MDKKRYESIMKRDFKYNLELYIFNLILYDNVDNASPEKFRDFGPGDELINDYRKACQLNTGNFKKTTINKIDELFESWYKDRDLKEYKEMFYSEFVKKLEFDKFKEVFTKDHTKNQCHYCGITEADILNLIDKESDKIKTKRLLTRGKSMEIDRINPFGDYSESNIILSCYWCNNAKTDEFSYEEFKDIIAPGITKVWSKRLGREIIAPSNRDKNKNNERK